MKKSCLVAMLCMTIFLLSGCADDMIQRVNLVSTFNAQQAESMLHDGDNTITGNAFMRQQGGGVITCAGSEVSLTPETAYATERIVHIYGNPNEGAARKGIIFYPDDPNYMRLMKTTKCDSQGNFIFENVADGSFYITTVVGWVDGQNNTQGGSLMKRVDVKDGQSMKVIMSQ